MNDFSGSYCAVPNVDVFSEQITALNAEPFHRMLVNLRGNKNGLSNEKNAVGPN